MRRVAVAELESIGGSDLHGPAVVGERLLGRLCEQDGIQVVERALLDRVLKEQCLSLSGVVAPNDAVLIGRLMGVDALVTGSLIRRPRRDVEVNLRLISAVDARVLGAATGVVTPDWPEGAVLDDKHPAPAPPVLNGDFAGFWERRRPGAPSCDGWERRVADLQEADLPFKIRYWAVRLAAGLDLRGLKRNPGSEIRDLAVRAAFYSGVRALLEDGGAEPLTPLERTALAKAEAAIEELDRRCGR